MEFDADSIDRRIWLGSIHAMRNTAALNNLNISHILSIIESDLSTSENDNYIRKHIRVEDVPTTDLLVEFDACYDFINGALSENETNNVLVHCAAGVSRSATITCMWVMRRYALSAKEALQQVIRARPSVRPNAGFAAQLFLFEKMNYKLDVNHTLYKEFRFECARIDFIDQNTSFGDVSKKHALRQRYRQAFIPPFGHETRLITDIYTCRQCHAELFTNADVSGHSRGTGLYDWFTRYSYFRESPLLPELECYERVFTNCLEWLMHQIDTPANNHYNAIKCPRCFVPVGSYNLNGAKCYCGRWVVPGFVFDVEAIERSIVTNTETETETKEGTAKKE